MLHTGRRECCRGPGFPRRRGRAWARVKALPTDAQSQAAGHPWRAGPGPGCSCWWGVHSSRRPALFRMDWPQQPRAPAAAGSCPQPSLRLTSSHGVTACRPCGALALRVELFPPHSTPSALCPLHYQSWLARVTIYHKVASLERISTSPNKASSFCSLTRSHHYLITSVPSYRILLESWFQRCCVQLPIKKWLFPTLDALLIV